MTPEPQPRSVSAEAMLARLQPLLPAMGISRVGVLTGLDVVGIPVAAAYRPNSRSIAVHQGKGVSLAAAKISAVMEAVECCHAEEFDGPLRLASLADVARSGPVVAVARLPCLAPLGEARILWASARDLLAGGDIQVPFELVSADFTLPAPAGFGRFRQTTNGLASGPTWTEAVLQGLCEAIERDAVAHWHAGSPERRGAGVVDVASVTGEANRWLLRRFADAGVAVRLWNVSAIGEVPVFMALAAEADGVAGVEPELGAGCHPDAEVAVARALLEAAQARLTRISGARDDFLPDSYALAARAERHDAGRRLLAMPPRAPFRPHRGAGSAEADLAATLAALADAGIASVACADLTREAVGVPVVRVIVPGLDVP